MHKIATEDRKPRDDNGVQSWWVLSVRQVKNGILRLIKRPDIPLHLVIVRYFWRYIQIFSLKRCAVLVGAILFPIIPSLYHSIKMHQIRDGDFADFTAFADYFFQCFQSSAFLRISEVSSFSHSNYRERNAEKNAYKITLTEHQREMQKNCLQKYP